MSPAARDHMTYPRKNATAMAMMMMAKSGLPFLLVVSPPVVTWPVARPRKRRSVAVPVATGV